VTSLPSTRRVLIVDDERDIRTTLHAVFGSAGYECRTAGNGREEAATPTPPSSCSPGPRT
jgi:CheY-like chemotaxis protein